MVRMRSEIPLSKNFIVEAEGTKKLNFLETVCIILSPLLAIPFSLFIYGKTLKVLFCLSVPIILYLLLIPSESYGKNNFRMIQTIRRKKRCTYHPIRKPEVNRDE